MRDFYDNFYRATQSSEAHRQFCTRVFGLDLCQHGFADVQQLDALITAARLGPGQHVLDLGCGTGLIAEYLSDQSGAHVTGLDFVPDAIRQAGERTRAKADRLAFVVGDINALDLPPAAYDVIVAIDTIYFSEDYAATVAALKQALRPEGRLAIFYSHGREPWVPLEEFDVSTLPAAHTPLAQALTSNGFDFVADDFSAADLRLAICRQQALADLRDQFEAEGNAFIYENRLGDANGIRQACEDGLQRRYLYIATAPSAPSHPLTLSWEFPNPVRRPARL
jgi:ubiquinone/menaquinone biosynthesis C-methylase UbiE